VSAGEVDEAVEMLGVALVSASSFEPGEGGHK